MIHKIEATVLRVEHITASGQMVAFNMPLYPWDDLSNIKAQVREAAAEAGNKILRMRKTTGLVQNPLLK